MQNKFLIVIVGPTAVGKTALSIDVARHFKTEIVSADSRQFFKEMTIGTAKPSVSELQAITHRFINSHAVTENVNVGSYELEALACLKTAFEKHNTVLLTGGSGLYINAVCEGLDNLPEGDENIRKELNALYETEGLGVLQQRLKNLDDVYFNQVDLSNPHRIIRALEVSMISGKPYSSFRIKQKKERPFSSIKIGLNLARPDLYARINQRVDLMIQDGLLEEVRSLIPFRNNNALQTVGYAELFDFLDGKMTFEEAVEKIKQNTRRYAKRQITWFKKDPEIVWFEPFEKEKILEHIEHSIHKKAH